METSGAVSDAATAKVIAWLEANMGGVVSSIRRQPRWRPMWFATIESGGETRRVLMRGERSDSELQFPLDHEMRFQRVLEQHDIKVPKLYGWCEDPVAFASEDVAGQADFKGCEKHREGVVDEYLQELVRVHQLPLEPFAAANIIRAVTPSGSATVGIERFETIFRRNKLRSDPLMEFMLGWLRRHPLVGRTREAPVVWDSGQFHHHDGHLVALVDLELGHIGDPMMDLAGWRMRDTVIGFGDFNTLYARYEQLSGTPIDMEAIQYHHLFFTLTNALSFIAPMAKPASVTDYMTYAQWVSETNLFAIETLAEYIGVRLDPVEVPDDQLSPVAQVHEHLATSLRNIEVDDEFARYQLRIAFRLARHLQRFDQIGDEITRADLDDLVAVLGHRPTTWMSGDAELEEYVLNDGGRHDEQLLQLFNRRWCRYKALMGPPRSAMATHHPLQPFTP